VPGFHISSLRDWRASRPPPHDPNPKQIKTDDFKTDDKIKIMPLCGWTDADARPSLFNF
jgi:hypothetical protein